MLNILERHITKTIIHATALVTLIISGVLFLMLLLTEFKNMGEGDYNFLQALFYVVLRLPSELYQFSPMILLLGCVTGLSILASYREIAVMRTAGFSMQRIIMSILSAALLLIVMISLIGEGVAPTLSYKAEVRKEMSQNAGQAVVTAAGVWFHVDNNFIHVQHVVGRELLEGVTRYQFDREHRLLAAYYAAMMSLENNQWRMHDVVKTSFYPDRTKSQTFAEANWDLKFNPNLLNVGLLDANEMSLVKLAKFSHYLEQNGLQATSYRYEFWQRIFQPFASLVMIFLAIPFVLGAFSTSTLGRRILIGILASFGFFIANALLGQLCIVYQLPALLAASLPLLAFALLGLFLFARIVRS